MSNIQNAQHDILIVDDEADICKLVQGILEDEGYTTRLAANAQQAYESIEEKAPSLIIQDIWLQGSEHDGLQILEKVKEDHPHLPIIMISGHGTIETAVSAIKQGAYDFIEKPFKAGRLLLMVSRALETAALKRENEILKSQNTAPQEEIIGSSASIKKLREMIERAGPADSNVLITGEPGSGKDMVARALHRSSERGDKPFMVLNCASLHPDRIEAALFGTEQIGTGEVQSGILEQAHGGTLLLDEVADMPLETQGKILRALQDQRFQRLGGARFVQVNVRIIATTNKNLEEAMQKGNFRQDLFYRLNVVPIAIPPLREHGEDIAPLCEYFMGQITKQSGHTPKHFDGRAMKILKSCEWPGNIRQLRNMVEWVMIMNGNIEGEDISPEQLPPDIYAHHTSADSTQDNTMSMHDVVASRIADSLSELPLREARESFERDYLSAQIERFDGNISKTAQFVGMERSALHRKLKSLDIATPDKNKDNGETLRKTA
jgi:two-component system nitrogen regulation response regulator NtrX